MALARKHWVIIASVILVIAAGIVVGIVVVEQRTVEQQVHDILAENPLIDG